MVHWENDLTDWIKRVKTTSIEYGKVHGKSQKLFEQKCSGGYMIYQNATVWPCWSKYTYIYIHIYISRKETLSENNLSPSCQSADQLTVAYMGHHAEDKWLIPGTKHRRDWSTCFPHKGPVMLICFMLWCGKLNMACAWTFNFYKWDIIKHSIYTHGLHKL